MSSHRIQKRFRINPDYLEHLETVKRENKLQTNGEAIEHILDENIKLRNQLLGNNKDDIAENTSKILKAVNQSSKDIKTLVEFANTHAFREMFEENVSAIDSPTNWLKEAKSEVNNQLQYKRTQKLSEH
ncbi:hypothetical protein [Staphylococcus sp. LCT-H4]|uniref:hypothetical protein n=1 Tax=Staphylococcus sp. LCT-H4 TaxID=1914308 RepID=UPI0008F552D2|nr:hypothetical protein [Staphylococcus sp. LCT-H4]OIJ29094.1 hypothetical protein BK821_12200 [Staphylococcus sp. LCT-H4]